MLSTRTDDLDELRHAMDAAVARASSRDGARNPGAILPASRRLRTQVRSELERSDRHEDGGGEGQGHAGDLDAMEALLQHHSGEHDRAHRIQRRQDGDHADEALPHGEEVEDVGEGVEGAGGGGELAARPGIGGVRG